MYEEIIRKHEGFERLIRARWSERQKDRPMKIAVCGKFKSGKTSLINLLLGIDLPVQAVTATKLVTRIGKGTGSYIESEDGSRIEITSDERNQLIMGDREAWILVGCDSPLLGKEDEIAIEIWDTPGLEDTPELTAITMQALHLCDLAILVFDANKFGSWYEKMTLEKLQELLGGNVVYVINRIDLLNTAEDLEYVKKSAGYLLEEYGNMLTGHGTTLYTSASPEHPDISALSHFVAALAEDAGLRGRLCGIAVESQLNCMLGEWTTRLAEDMSSLVREWETGCVEDSQKKHHLGSMKKLLDYYDYALHIYSFLPECSIGERQQLFGKWSAWLHRYELPGIPAVCPRSGKQEGLKIQVGDRQLCFGRNEMQCQVLYSDGTPGVSRFHCALVWDGDRREFVLADMNSSYGTYLQDGTRLIPGKLYWLTPGECFYLGDRNNEVKTGFIKNLEEYI